MREIKFRGWDGFGIHDVRGINFNAGVVDLANYSVHRDEVELMQYTGLKDIDDKDVYECDIILCGPSAIGLHLRVVFDNGAFLQVGRGMEPDIWYDWDEVSVVGNIYENKDLLEEVIL